MGIFIHTQILKKNMNKPELNKQQRLKLRRLSHSLKPVVITGSNELTPSVIAEINTALEAHELIKVRVNANDAEHRQKLTTAICEQCEAALIHQIGHIIVIFRTSSETA